MSSSHWRSTARAVIEQALREAAEHDLGDEQTRKLISSRYPFGARKYHPYKVWLSEVHIQIKRRARLQREIGTPSRPEFGGAILDEHEYTISPYVRTGDARSDGEGDTSKDTRA